jgi:glutamine cyclotransferase
MQSGSTTHGTDTARAPSRGMATVALALVGGAGVIALGAGACTQDPVPEQRAATTPPPAERPAPAQTPSPRTPPSGDAPRKVPVDGYEVVATYPHDPRSFTQGLAFDNGRLLESQGQYGESSLRLVELETGVVQKRLPLAPTVFAEGIAVLKGLVYQLTWREGVAFVYTVGDLKQVGSFPFEGEGWGLTTDGTSLIASTGRDELRFIDPKTLKVSRSVRVRAAGVPQSELNELEWIEGEIWANVWHKDQILRIDPKTGDVVSIVDLRGLLPDRERRDYEHCLNGIAYDAAKKRIFVTGKCWPKLFEIRVKKRG